MMLKQIVWKGQGMDILNVTSAIFNFTGTIIIAFSVIENPGGGYQEVKGQKIFLASLLLNKFRLGICIIIFGFLLQLLAAFSGYEKFFPNRYVFRNPDQLLSKRCEILDTATGKIYLWNESAQSKDGTELGGTIEITDPINNVVTVPGALKTKGN